MMAAAVKVLVVLAARGTSDNAAQFARYLLEITTGIPVSLAAPSIFTLYGATIQMKDVLVVAISQSGESTDTNYVLERAREQGGFCQGQATECEPLRAPGRRASWEDLLPSIDLDRRYRAKGDLGGIGARGQLRFKVQREIAQRD